MPCLLMKVCSNCQAPYTDDSLKFCLQCGTPLLELPKPDKGGGNGVIAAAILGGFLLLTLVVGGLGVYIFSRPDNEIKTAPTNSENSQDNLNERIAVKNNQEPVEQLNGNKRSSPFPVNPIDAPTSRETPSNVLPRIVASSSSVRKPDDGNFYFPNLAFDNNSATAWCEGAPGAGQGEWLQFNFDREITLKTIKIQPGYFKNEQTWRKNNRVAKVSVKVSDHIMREFYLSDERKTQTLEVGNARTNWVKITVEDYFPGASDSKDTLISEVSFVTEP